MTWWEELGLKLEGPGFGPDAVTSVLYHLACLSLSFPHLQNGNKNFYFIGLIELKYVTTTWQKAMA